MRQVLNLLEVEGLLLIVFGLTCLLNPSDLLLLLERQIHTLCHFLFLTDHVLPQQVEFVFGLEFDAFTLFERLCKTLACGLLPSGHLRLLLLDIAQLRVVDILILALLLLELGQVRLDLGMSLLGQLSLKHQPALGCLVEEIGAVGEAIVAELLRDALRVGTLGSLLDEVVKEAEDLVVEAFEAVILIIVKLLSNRVIIPL